MRVLIPRTIQRLSCVDEVDAAVDGKHGLDLFRQNNGDYGLIITDYEMPNMNGLEFLDHIRGYAHPPRIMMSGKANESLYHRARSLGAQGVILNHFEPDFFRQVVKEFIEQSASPTLDEYVTEMNAKEWQ